MKIIFCDTNILFGIFKRICLGESVQNSDLFVLAKKHTIVISDFVVEEISRNLGKKYNIILEEKHLMQFLKISSILIMKSQILRGDSIYFVHDLEDAQILQDALDIDADFLITKNIKDFDIRGIYEKYDLKISSELPINI